MATQRLATWAQALTYPDLPHEVSHAAVRSFYNWVGCAIGGSQHEATTIARNSLSPFFGAPTSSLLGHHGIQIDAQHAALINGIASHVHDYDDTHLDTIIHPTGPVASALLAVAEWKKGVSGEDFIVALVAGIEAECKVGLTVWPEHYDVGWHITSSAGSIGAAVAVSKILRLSTVQTSHAIGLAATQVIGLREMFGSHTKSFHPGRAAQCGLLAAVLAENGYTSSEKALEANRGWANVVGATKADAAQNLDRWLSVNGPDGLASTGSQVGRWEILRNSFKPFPCGIVIHPIIDACIQLRREIGEDNANPQSIKSVTAKVHPLVLELTGKKTPKDGLEGKFSVYHSGACGLLFGKATPAEYADGVVRDPKVIALRDLITAEIHPTLMPEQATVTVALKDGRTFTKDITNAVGSLEVPLSDEMLETKFIGQCMPVLAGQVHRASEACWAIETSDDIADIVQFLRL
ncbi:hypothetical protein N7468_005740 [Penicillium chermesinum]|uniref:2-methylcitrate dehydratase PrpD n=1 Tax=Penicillium chermesinum TaxID=63820 RepID=A0A9W9NZV8_9EURO|nr:uncharacterized protein N7468_005740 [Penicillium chermesinum]KAJ5232784.1 hypothetical protein N7468_005740 [Penicillium chermesinum]KAJ6172444.1 hypothetical protein N7470_001511 [Penicillium chermesinum]